MNEKEYFEEDEEEDQFFKGEIQHVSPSKIADQFWCEMQLHLRLELGMEPTEEMIQGTKIHRQLEEELGPVIEIEVTTLEDSIISYILLIYTKLELLFKLGITRELPVIGRINDFYCIGIIDQLQIENFNSNEEELVITDYKTRKSKSPPSYEQKRRNRIQMQIYWHLLTDLQQGNFEKERFKDYFGMTSDISPSKELLVQLPEDYLLLLQKKGPEKLLTEIFDLFRKLPNLSPEIKAVYLHQEDQSVVFSDISLFHRESFDVDMEWAIGYWKKERTPNSCPQQWMCKFCQFTDKCSYFLKRYLNENKKEEKKTL